ncbi:hypothetical protein J4E83_004674 [Alternaria metachromatica]|uniref:uncharacterized protein n=1 Tax=Alternaria metachromatica TaxID=283354 RepID=UPI0020C21D17|nr:uncharacterized protein J4E83_004674 [Alternaria metachromatica]KAI4623281.1 hypothetical protein J4E83_004674 [Alternaria metachromatica]
MLGDMVAAFRNHDDLLVSELRHHNLDVPGPSPSDPRFQRALRAIHELEPMPACVMPHPVTGGYTTVETRYRRLFILGTDPVSGVTFENRWRYRSEFVRDLGRLEQLRLDLGPQPTSNNRPEPSLEQTRLLIEFGALLDKLMPDTRDSLPIETLLLSNDPPSDALVRSIDPQLLLEARLFSVLSVATERDLRQSFEEVVSSVDPGYSWQSRERAGERAIRNILGEYRHHWFINKGIYRHYMTSHSQAGQSTGVVPIPQETTVVSVVRFPTRPAHQREVSLMRPSQGIMWQPSMSPFRSSAAESQSMRVSWFDEMPRGANAEALLDPEYLQWRQEQVEPSRFNSPRAVGQLPCTPDMDELVRPPQNREPDLHPEQMSRRGEIHEAISSELQPLIPGLQAQAEASRQLPRQAIRDRSVQTNANAMGARVIRMLRNSLHRRRSQ